MPKNRAALLCPYCHSELITKYGKRKIKRTIVQVYKCQTCSKYFSDKKLKYKSYAIKTILNALSCYNLGYTLEQAKKQLAKRLHQTVPCSTLCSWVTQYKDTCTYHRLREQAKQLYSPDFIIFSKKFYHEQVYNFQVHKAKLGLLFEDTEFSKHKKFLPVKEYLEKVPTENFPHHIFGPKESCPEDQKTENRASQLKICLLPAIKLSKNNLANKLAELALQLAKNNKERHEKVQRFMLVNDSTTVAVEVPVYLTHDDIGYFKERNFALNFENYRTPLTGHIDILQIRNNSIHILDYKPEAEKEKKAVKQLTVYALALASRTKLPLSCFKCAWFDEKNYYEFFPLHCVYTKKANQNI
ncbi:MAG: PD-(D/E)XK nuclease family protein [Nanoarchaeota archaeon]|nr:PD-(D/E)XK nuclease family protein [Nanoarchaeota archaeon]